MGADVLVGVGLDVDVRDLARRVHACVGSAGDDQPARAFEPVEQGMVTPPTELPSNRRARAVSRPSWTAFAVRQWRADPGSAVLRCCSASMLSGSTLVIAAETLFFQPATT